MLKTRVLTALLLLPIIVIALFYFSSAAWMFFCALLMALGAWEWKDIAGMSGIVAKIYPVLTAGIFLLCVNFAPAYFQYGLLLASLGFWLVFVPCWLRFKWPLLNAGNLNVFSGWALLIPAGLAMVILRGDGWPLLMIMAVAWIADSFAYFSGKAFGKRKLAPTISPGKSWEGVYGGTFAVVCYFMVIPKPFSFLPFISSLQNTKGQVLLWAIFAVVITAVSVMGDLLESMLKRQRGIKDSSHMLPGHGGILDRIDSLLAILPVSAAIYLLHLMPL
ncbi:MULTISPECIES: phosphatidate cytidylyltransferase [Deefgea]|uniref:Phosphatidate cytidylyltransferase n=1 Tax=Deefgea chitinilytica TaxID=570276 RepID=A0ABS2C8M8_9NEIS|nr:MULTISPECIES: phosphatidate cytidylyltransferase [Deefgea]MBM5570510.1 phosphatidate cytidylyltransferase [Deefgea chitinilytica]MBM9887739.1 phosphatidate cytidylyltransferase [Deefgea sp. CFH1-16]